MSDIREILDGIESTARRAPGMPPLWFYRQAITDVPCLVAALRVVLDDCDVADRLTQGEGAALVSTTRIRQGIAIALSSGS